MCKSPVTRLRKIHSTSADHDSRILLSTDLSNRFRRVMELESSRSVLFTYQPRRIECMNYLVTQAICPKIILGTRLKSRSAYSNSNSNSSSAIFKGLSCEFIRWFRSPKVIEILTLKRETVFASSLQTSKDSRFRQPR